MSGDDTSLPDLNKNLLKLLECPVCYEYCTPPIQQCGNGHNICSKCEPSVNNCPICRTKITKGRNPFAENVAEVCLFPCSYAKAGCDVNMLRKNLLNHNETCVYRKYHCDFGGDDGCSWTGQLVELRDHIKDNHWDCSHESHEVSLTWKAGSSVNLVTAMFAYHEMFVSHVWYKNGKVYGAVKYFGEADDATKFVYEFEMFSKNLLDRILFRHVTHADFLSLDTIMESKECFMVDNDYVTKFLNDDNKVEIKCSVILIKHVKYRPDISYIKYGAMGPNWKLKPLKRY